MSRFPERVGWYELLAPIGAGGMATVYLGLAERGGGFERHVAVKMLHGTADGEGQLAAALLREAKLVAQIRHPNVVPVIDVGEDPFGLYLVMEYIEGDNLAALKRAAKRLGEGIPLPIALRIITDALAGLHAAHELAGPDGTNLGVVHRDFSPHNIMVGTDGVSRLTDFGIAKVALTQGHTRTGRIKGKISYMSPEQARAQPVDRRCDVWAAGVVAWEVFSGQRLYEADDEISALLKVVSEDPPRLSELRPDLPAWLDETVAWALSRELAQRCPSADALRRRLISVQAPADISEVAEFVRRVLGPKLAERKQKIAEIRQLRSKIGELSGAIGSSPRASAGSLTPGRMGSTPSLLDRAGYVEAPFTEQSGEIDPGTTLATSGTVDKPKPKPDWRRRAALIGVASGLAIGVVAIGIGIAISVGGKETDIEASGSSRPAKTEAPAAPLPPPTSALVAPPLEPTLKLKGNAAIASVTIGNTTERVSPPAETVSLKGSFAPDTPIEAVAADGRKAKATVRAAGEEVELVFPKRKAVRAGSGNMGFADNPYKKK